MTNDASLERDNDIFYWVYPFTTYITFLEGDGYHRNKLESDITLNEILTKKSWCGNAPMVAPPLLNGKRRGNNINNPYPITQSNLESERAL